MFLNRLGIGSIKLKHNLVHCLICKGIYGEAEFSKTELRFNIIFQRQEFRFLVQVKQPHYQDAEINFVIEVLEFNDRFMKARSRQIHSRRVDDQSTK
jgi:hypothetical protein